MIKFEGITIGQFIYIVEHEPVTILELKVLNIGYTSDYIKRIKVANADISFEIDFDTVSQNCFDNKETAYAAATKFIFDETNQFIRTLTDNTFQDYFELDQAIERYKISNPEMFI